MQLKRGPALAERGGRERGVLLVLAVGQEAGKGGSGSGLGQGALGCWLRSRPNQGKREQAARFAGLGEEGKAGPVEEKGWA